jgi:hypothetical protein
VCYYVNQEIPVLTFKEVPSAKKFTFNEGVKKIRAIKIAPTQVLSFCGWVVYTGNAVLLTEDNLVTRYTGEILMIPDEQEVVLD